MTVPVLTGPMIATLVICGAALLLFVWNRLPFEIVGLLVLVALPLSGLITPHQAISGFSNDATVTVGAILFLSAGLERTGVVDAIGRGISRVGKGGELRILTVVVGTTLIASAFLNNTAVVAMLIPVVQKLARDNDLSPSRLLIPLSYGSQVGGTLTLIGTSTNILTAGLVADHGLPPLRLFTFTGAALPLAIVGFIYLLTLGRFLLPHRGGTEDAAGFPFEEFQSALIVDPDSPYVDQTWGTVTFPRAESLRVTKGRRGQRDISANEPLEPGDVLLVEGLSADLAKVTQSTGLTVPGMQPRSDSDDDHDDELVLTEAVVPPRSRLIGKEVRSVGPLAWGGAVVLAMQRKNVRLDRPGALLQAGDLLLVEGSRPTLHRMQRRGLLIQTTPAYARPSRRPKGWLAASIFAGVVLVAAIGWMPIVLSSLLGVIAMVVTRCLSPTEAFERMDWSVLLLLGSIIPLGIAMETTGTATLLASLVLQLTEGRDPRLVLAVLFLITSILTEFISNNAAVVLLVPVGIAVAGTLDVSPMPFIIAVMFAASNSFMTPVGYQTNTFVLGPGRYRFTDYTKVGGPLSVLFLVLSALVIPLFFPF